MCAAPKTRRGGAGGALERQSANAARRKERRGGRRAAPVRAAVRRTRYVVTKKTVFKWQVAAAASNQLQTALQQSQPPFAADTSEWWCHGHGDRESERGYLRMVARWRRPSARVVAQRRVDRCRKDRARRARWFVCLFVCVPPRERARSLPRERCESILGWARTDGRCII
jgi:hypothetical protein